MISFKGLEKKVVEKQNVRKKLASGLDIAYYLLDSVGVALSPEESFFMDSKLMALRLPIGYPKQELEQGFEQIKFALSKLKTDDNPHIQSYSQTTQISSQTKKQPSLTRSTSL